MNRTVKNISMMKKEHIQRTGELQSEFAGTGSGDQDPPLFLDITEVTYCSLTGLSPINKEILYILRVEITYLVLTESQLYVCQARHGCSVKKARIRIHLCLPHK